MEPALDPYLAWLLYNDANEMLGCAPGTCKVGPNASDLTKLGLDNLTPYLFQPNGATSCDIRARSTPGWIASSPTVVSRR